MYATHVELFEETDTPGTYLILLPDGCVPGRWEAAHEFAKRITALKAHVGEKQLMVVPFAYKGMVDGFLRKQNHGPVELAVEAYLAIVT